MRTQTDPKLHLVPRTITCHLCGATGPAGDVPHEKGCLLAYGLRGVYYILGTRKVWNALGVLATLASLCGAPATQDGPPVLFAPNPEVLGYNPFANVPFPSGPVIFAPNPEVLGYNPFTNTPLAPRWLEVFYEKMGVIY